jgi:type VI secretion system protein ImpH
MANQVSLDKVCLWRGGVYQLLYAWQQYKQIDLKRSCQLKIANYQYASTRQVVAIKNNQTVWEMTVNMPGLVGMLGILPREDQQLTAVKNKQIRVANLAWLDIFHHRLILLTYQSWLGHRLLLQYQSNHQPRNQQHKLLVHLASQEKSELPIEVFMIRHALLLRKGFVSISSLQSLLQDYLQIPSRIRGFNIVRHKLTHEQQTKLASYHVQNQLGYDAHLGSQIQMAQNQIAIEIGPLSYEQYCACLPEGSILEQIKQLIQKYVPCSIETKAQLYLKKHDCPLLRLKQNHMQLGRTAWLPAHATNDSLKGCVLTIT